MASKKNSILVEMGNTLINKSAFKALNDDFISLDSVNSRYKVAVLCIYLSVFSIDGTKGLKHIKYTKHCH